MKGKFGRILGDFTVYHAPTDSWRMVTEIMVEEGHAVAYFGGSKDEIQQKHMANRGKLIREGVVNMSEEQAGII
jgi:endonuclease YncB( thermonuclease family)